MPEEQIIVDETLDINPDTIPVETWDEFIQGDSNVIQVGAGLSPVGQPIQSTNYAQNSVGWRFNSNGEAEMNGNRTVSTNFSLIFKARGVSFYVSNGNTPNGALSGTTGDICFNGGSGNVFRCTGTTNWTAL